MRKGLVIMILMAAAATQASAQGVKMPERQTLVVADTLSKPPASFYFLPKPILSKDNYYHSLGLACKVEFKMEKATKIPLRLRVGSLQQTDYLEQKPNAQKP